MPETNFFVFSIATYSNGIVESELSIQESRDKLNRELSAAYGPDQVSVIEFREATSDEIEQYQSAVLEHSAAEATIQ